MFKIILNYRNLRSLRRLPTLNSSLNFHVSGSSVSSQDYDISEDLMMNIPSSKKHSDEADEKRGRVSRTLIKRKLKFYLDCSEAEIEQLLKGNKLFYITSLAKLTGMIEFLFDKKIATNTILENPWLLEMNPEIIEEKLKFVEKLEPSTNINDYIPLIRNSPSQISKINRIFRREKESVPGGNRIQYFAAKIGVEPMIVSKYFSSRMFMFEIGLDQMYENLDIMLKYEVSALSILNDLWGFKYLPNSIRTRLERCKSGDKENLKPWVIRCSEPILERSLEITRESKDLLAGKTIVEYLSERLGYDVETMQAILMKHEPLFKVRPKRAQEILDYLMNEEDYQPYEIANVIRILCHSLETTKQRINELKSYGCRPTSLVIVCKSRTEYKKFLDSWIEKKHRLESRGVNSYQ